MQTLTEKVFHLAPPGGLFNDTVVANLFPEQSIAARRALVHRAVKSGEILALKPGLYCLAKDYRKSHPHPFVAAGALYSPSHISLESALSYHGLIPEGVREVASVTGRRGRAFDTPFGIFTFSRVPCINPRAGVRIVEVDKNAWAFIACPLRAVADLVYLRRDVCWGKDGLRFLTDSMRIEPEDLSDFASDDFDEIQAGLSSKRTRQYLEGLAKELRL